LVERWSRWLVLGIIESEALLFLQFSLTELGSAKSILESLLGECLEASVVFGERNEVKEAFRCHYVLDIGFFESESYLIFFVGQADG